MSANSNFTHATQMTQPVIQVHTNGYLQTQFLHRVQGLTGRLAFWWKEEPHPTEAMDFELGNERFVKDGYFRVSVKQAQRERTIDIHTVNLLLPRIR